MATDFACHCDYLSGSRALVTAAGELDLHSCSEFKKTIDAAARRAPVHLVFDLTAVTFMDSTALGVLASEQRRRSEPLHLVVRESQLLRILRVTGYDRVFVIHGSVEDALLDTGRREVERGRPA
jgi:anti-sigma B factor antagonist